MEKRMKYKKTTPVTSNRFFGKPWATKQKIEFIIKYGSVLYPFFMKMYNKYRMNNKSLINADWNIKVDRQR